MKLKELNAFSARVLISLLPKLNAFLRNKNNRGHLNNDHIVLLATTVKTINNVLNPKKSTDLKREYTNLIKLIKIIVKIPKFLDPPDVVELTTIETEFQKTDFKNVESQTNNNPK